jgi:hypothetical protein
MDASAITTACCHLEGQCTCQKISHLLSFGDWFFAFFKGCITILQSRNVHRECILFSLPLVHCPRNLCIVLSLVDVLIWISGPISRHGRDNVQPFQRLSRLHPLGRRRSRGICSPLCAGLYWCRGFRIRRMDRVLHCCLPCQVFFSVLGSVPQD